MTTKHALNARAQHTTQVETHDTQERVASMHQWVMNPRGDDCSQANPGCIDGIIDCCKANTVVVLGEVTRMVYVIVGVAHLARP